MIRARSRGEGVAFLILFFCSGYWMLQTAIIMVCTRTFQALKLLVICMHWPLYISKTLTSDRNNLCKWSIVHIRFRKRPHTGRYVVIKKSRLARCCTWLLIIIVHVARFPLPFSIQGAPVPTSLAVISPRLGMAAIPGMQDALLDYRNFWSAKCEQFRFMYIHTRKHWTGLITWSNFWDAASTWARRNSVAPPAIHRFCESCHVYDWVGLRLFMGHIIWMYR